MKKAIKFLSLFIALITLTLFLSDSVLAAETGKTPDTAKVITPNVGYKNNLADSLTWNWYKVTFPEQGKIRIVLDHAILSEGYYRVDFYWDYGNNNYGISLPNDSDCEKTKSDYFRSSKGTYYFRVLSPVHHTDADYTITIEYTPESSKDFETELNNSPATANTLIPNKEMRANLSAKDDADWYKVTIPIAGRARIAFAHEILSENYYQVDFFTDYGVDNTKGFHMFNSPSSARSYTDYFDISEGIYYIRMHSSDNFSNADYGIKIEYEAPGYYSENITNFVTRLYNTCLGRTPDAGGLDFWSEGLSEKTMTGGGAANFFLTSPEIVNKNLSNEEYIKVLYRSLMGREYDPAGLAFWNEVLAGGAPRMEVVRHFLYSEEFEEICKEYEIIRGDIY